MRSVLRGASDDTVETAALLTSELVTSALGSARSDPQLFLDARNGHIHVEVRDAEAQQVSDLPIDEPREPSGWELDIMNALASSWGIEHRPDGKATWFDLAF